MEHAPKRVIRVGIITIRVAALLAISSLYGAALAEPRSFESAQPSEVACRHGDIVIYHYTPTHDEAFENLAVEHAVQSVRPLFGSNLAEVLDDVHRLGVRGLSLGGASAALLIGDTEATLSALPLLPDEHLPLLERAPDIQYLKLSATAMRDEHLQYVTSLTELQGLYLAHTQVTDAAFFQLRNLQNLQELSLTTSQITGRGLSLLSSLRNLTYLQLGADIDDAGLREIGEARSLRSLHLVLSERVSDVGVRNLAGLSKLETVVIVGRVPPNTLDVLSNMPNLRSLTLTLPPAIESDDLHHLYGMGALQILHLSKASRIGDADIDQLIRLKGLVSLYLEGTTISPEGWRRLRAGLPGTVVQDD